MYPKYKIQEIIDTIVPALKRHLNLEHHEVNYHILHSKSKKVKDLKLQNKDIAALCYASRIDSSDIVIYYDQQTSRKDAIGSVIHELLHARIHALSSLITIKQDLAESIEENLVKDLEAFAVELLLN